MVQSFKRQYQQSDGVLPAAISWQPSASALPGHAGQDGPRPIGPNGKRGRSSGKPIGPAGGRRQQDESAYRKGCLGQHHRGLGLQRQQLSTFISDGTSGASSRMEESDHSYQLIQSRQVILERSAFMFALLLHISISHMKNESLVLAGHRVGLLLRLKLHHSVVCLHWKRKDLVIGGSLGVYPRKGNFAVRGGVQDVESLCPWAQFLQGFESLERGFFEGYLRRKRSHCLEFGLDELQGLLYEIFSNTHFMEQVCVF